MWEGWETAPELLAAAEVAGCPVTAGQLARWHRAGLLPSPRQRSLGRGRGSVTCYPPGSTDQLLVLLSLRPHRRGLDELAWAMWWERSEIPTARARPYATRTFQNMSTVLSRLVDTDGNFTDEVEQFLDRADQARFEQRPLGWARSRLGTYDFDQLLEGLLRLVSSGGGAACEQTAALIERGFRLDRARNDPGPDGTGWLTGPLAETLADAAEMLNPDRLDAVIAASSDLELQRARDEVRQFVAVLVSLGRMVDALGDRWAYGFGPVGGLADAMISAPAGQVQLVAVWRSLEQAGNRDGMDAMLSIAADLRVPSAAPDFLRELRRRVPQTRPALRLTAGSLGDPARHEAAEERIRQLRHRHATEIDALAAEIGLTANDGPPGEPVPSPLQPSEKMPGSAADLRGPGQ